MEVLLKVLSPFFPHQWKRGDNHIAKVLSTHGVRYLRGLAYRFDNPKLYYKNPGTVSMVESLHDQILIHSFQLEPTCNQSDGKLTSQLYQNSATAYDIEEMYYTDFSSAPPSS